MDYSNIMYLKDNQVATITLNRPDAMNALSPDLLSELQYAISVASTDQDLKALVIRGNGRSFCAGADLLFFDSAFENVSLLNPYIQLLNQCFLDLENLAIPTVAVVQGFALAGGLELAMACDMRIACESSKFTTAFAKVGFPGDFGGTFFLTQMVGTAKARELYYLSTILTANEAKDLGIINKVATDDELQDTNGLDLREGKGIFNLGIRWSATDNLMLEFNFNDTFKNIKSAF